MKNTVLLMLAFFALSCSGNRGAMSSNTQPGKETLLFDGKTLNGWHAYNKTGPIKNWIIEDGVLVCLGKAQGDVGGDIVTDAEYANFEFSWEWKLNTGGNSGVMYHVVEDPKYPGPYETGPEYQMIDDSGHPDGLKGGSHTTASIYDIKEPIPGKLVKPAGEWNSSKIVVQDGKIQHWLNGALASEADTTTPEWKEMIAKSKFKNKEGFAPGQGKIMLTEHGDETWFRNIRISAN